MPEEKRQVFISYSRRDLDFVEQLAADLEAVNQVDLKVWYDLSRLEGGDTWPEEIQSAIDASDIFIIVISPDSVVSKWVRKEFLYANHIGKKTIPLLYKKCDLPLFLLDIHYIDVRGKNYKRNFNEILRAMDVSSVKINETKKLPKWSIFIALSVVLIVFILSIFNLPLLPSQPENTATPTFTSTINPSATYTPTSTRTPTIQPTLTKFITPTISAPFSYTVQEGEFLATIVEKFDLGSDGAELILYLNPYDKDNGTGINPATQIVYPGQEILLPNPGMKLPTATAVSNDLEPGAIIIYTLQAGDTLAGVASTYNSTVDAIIEENNLDDPNAIFVGQQLKVPVNIAPP
jgi:LysM repeat protein